MIKSDKIEFISIEQIVPNPKNNNKHSEDQIRRLAKIIQHNGFRVPLIISNRSGLLISGHGRLEAAKILGLETLPVIFQDFKNEAEEIQFLTADNEIARWAELDKDLVKDFLAESGTEFDLDLLGIKDFTLLDPIEDNQEDDDTFGDDENKKWIIEVTFPNEMEMMDIHDDLTFRGYISKIKK